MFEVSFSCNNIGMYQNQWRMGWLVPVPSNSHHQDCYMFNGGPNDIFSGGVWMSTWRTISVSK